MDLSDPTRALTPTLDGPVLAVLAQTGRPLTVGQIAVQAARGSEIGIRRTVARLVQQGVVTAVQMGRNQVHELNRDHIAAPAAELLADLRLELWTRLRRTIGRWDPKPLYACAFGSAARGEGGAQSDIDVLLVHQPLRAEKLNRSRQKELAAFADDLVAPVGSTPLTDAEAEAWQSQLDSLYTDVQRWTGNPLQIVDLSIWQWASRSQTEPALFEEIERDAVVLLEAPIMVPKRDR